MNVVAASDRTALAGVMGCGWEVSSAVAAEVAKILADVAARGDAALVDYARRFDDNGFDLEKLRVPIPALPEARASVPPEVATSLELEMERLSRFHQRQRLPNITQVDEDGTRYALLRRPLRSVAVYAPRAAAATAVLMGTVPARIAGVDRVVALSPPERGELSASLLFACALCSVDELYAIGGAHAIAAAAFGTASLGCVDKIVGRGSIWTTEAKRQVFGRCGIDTLAGPPELLVVADESANSEYVVAELLAQAERIGASRLAVAAESRPLLEAVAQLIDSLDLEALDDRAVSGAIGDRCRLIACESRDELFEVVERFAPAYLCLHVRDAWACLERVSAAGAVFIGSATPLVAGEYLTGTNGIVPTSGCARFSSALSLGDFVHSISVVENSAERIRNDVPALTALAEGDGLTYHAQAARMRSGK
jgi:histidinol dehydrogenase